MSVSSLFEGKLKAAEGTRIQLNGSSVGVFEAFRKIPRTGKACRIDAFHLQLPKRSLFDHLPSMAAQADVFLKYARSAISEEVMAELILFHDWHEVIIGDVPEFTPKELAGDLYMSAEDKVKRQAKADELIVNSLSGSIKQQYVALDGFFHKPDPFFIMVDKTDPIIAIWRYLYLLKDKIDIEKFLEAMTHFFTNPKVVPVCISEDIASFIAFLQNKDNARAFFNKGFDVFQNSKISVADIKALLQRKMHFV